MPGAEGAAGGPATDCPPVVFIAFNRPDLTEEAFAVVRRVAPRQLLLIADGPRQDVPDDEALCAATRTILDNIDWPCEVLRKYEDRNLGCGPAVSSGLDWAFDQVPEAVILEDDCLVDPSFFPFCSELLDRYRGDGRVMQIAGSNLAAPPDAYLGDSYTFSAFSPVWGWATWRAAWARYDYTMRTWPKFRDSGMMAGLPAGRRWQAGLRRDWDRAHRGEATWDHQWQYAVMSGHGLSVSPSVNLVSNLGFRADATQTVLAGDLARIPSGTMPFPLRHPPLVAENPMLERHFERQMLEHTGRSVEFLRKALPSHRARRFLKGVLRMART